MVCDEGGVKGRKVHIGPQSIMYFTHPFLPQKVLKRIPRPEMPARRRKKPNPFNRFKRSRRQIEVDRQILARSDTLLDEKHPSAQIDIRVTSNFLIHTWFEVAPFSNLIRLVKLPIPSIPTST